MKIAFYGVLFSLVASEALASIAAVELPPVAAVELTPANLAPVRAVELTPASLTPVAAVELAPFDAGNPAAPQSIIVASAAAPAQKKSQAIAPEPQWNAPVEVWHPVPHAPGAKPAEFNPSVY